MKPVTAVIYAVGKGEVTLRFANAVELVFKTKRGFKYGERVFVLYDHHLSVVKDVFYPKELDISDEVAPECPPDERSVGDKALDEGAGVGDSFPPPDGRLLEFCEPELGLEFGVEDSLQPSDGRLLEFDSGDDV